MTASDTGPDTGSHRLEEALAAADTSEQIAAADGWDAAWELQEALVALGTLLLSTPSVEEYLTRVAGLAAAVFDPPATCGVTLYVGGEPMTVAASGPLAGQVEETQYEAGDGPCLASLRSGEPVDVPDLLLDDRWPEYRTHALSLGLRATHTAPLAGSTGVLGAINVHAAEPSGIDEAARRALRLFAAQTSAALDLLHRDVEQRRLGVQLQEALASRAVIDQAMGIVMATRRCSAEDAFAFLRRTSQNANRKLRDVANDLVTAVATGTSPLTPRPPRR